MLIGIDVNILSESLEKTASALSKVSRMSFSPIENRCRRIVKAFALLATFTRYREMENEGDKTGC